ncbi:hypothetical protein ACFW9D_30450 [Streptomyces sp. NPDC059524]|uniref:hypothetical protein n=1 Tax=Streptomyces sp. NPDC059524 TaxID=3346856 RepID=UPI0036C2CFF4
MTPTQTAVPAPTGRRRRALVPAPAESVQQRASRKPAARAPEPQDPPIYRELLASWADRGRTLPGRPDPEWARLVAPTVRTGEFGGALSESPDPRGDER